MKLNVAIFSIWFSVGMPSFVMGQGATERADSVPTRYEKMMARRMEGWKRLIPDHYKIQFAGSIGPPLPYCLAMVITTLFIPITIPFCLCCFHPQRLTSRVIHPDMLS